MHECCGAFAYFPTFRPQFHTYYQFCAPDSRSYENGYKLSGVIYIHRISDFRMTGVSRRNFTMFRKLCGDSVLKNVVIVTNMWGEVTAERGEARERELATDDVLFKRVLEKGARMVRHDNTRESAQAILRSLVNKTPRALRIQRELVDEHKDISQTAAGAELSRELDELAAKQREELAQVNADMDEALQAKDAESREELEKVRAELEAKVKRIEDDRERLSLEYAQEKKRADEKIMMAVKAEEEARAQMQAHVDQLGAGPRNNAYVSTVERDRMRNEVFYFPQSQPHFDLFALLGRLLGSLFRS
ncbi:hypothetical protein OBBRIDRAFT_799197 [Obba rivulosa]|uniref:Uncharacterized protein n=1 Tax=Obba rivulosa TaxID=1052685 RepID=A0A8E2ALU1_9APHY|nr:hypothetical protein OBBRIDRAFT_799197 [Obba rivulosa]